MITKNRTEFCRLMQSRKFVIAEKLLECQFQKQPHLKQKYSESDLYEYRNDCGYHIDFLSQAIAYESTEIFRDYIIWAKQLFKSLNIPQEQVGVFFRCFKEVLESEYPAGEEFGLNTYLDIVIDEIKIDAIETPSYILETQPLFNEARYVLAMLLKGKKDKAARFIDELVKKGLSIQDCYLHIFQTVQYEVGRLWHAHLISVAMEHYVTSATQVIMSQFYPQIFSHAKTGRSLVAACISGEQHEIGLRMITDLLEIDGWDTYFLGANTPITAIPDIVLSKRVNLLALSITLSTNLQKMEMLINSMKQQAPHVKILVGGYPFNIDILLWQKVGADGYGSDAKQAIIKAKELIKVA